MDEEELVRYQERLAGAKGIAKAESRFGKPMGQLTDEEIATGTREAIARRNRFLTPNHPLKFPSDYYAYVAEGNRRRHARRRKT